MSFVMKFAIFNVQLINVNRTKLHHISYASYAMLGKNVSYSRKNLCRPKCNTEIQITKIQRISELTLDYLAMVKVE